MNEQLEEEEDDPELGVSTIVDAVAWSPDGNLLAVGSGDYWGPDGTSNFWVRVVNVTTQQVIFSVPHQGAVKLAWGKSGNHLFVGSRNGAIQRYDVTTALLQAELAPRMLTIWSNMADMSLSPDSTRIAAIFRRTLGNMEFTIYDAQSLQPIVTLDVPFSTQAGNLLTWVGYNPDGGVLATTGWDGMVRLWDANTLSQIAVLSTSPGERLYVGDWSADGRLAVSGIDKRIAIWDVDHQAVLNITNIVGATLSLKWHPDGRQIAVYPAGVWDTLTGQKIQSLGSSSSEAIDWSPSGVLATGVRTQGRLQIQPNDNPLGSLASLTTVAPLPTTMADDPGGDVP